MKEEINRKYGTILYSFRLLPVTKYEVQICREKWKQQQPADVGIARKLRKTQRKEKRVRPLVS